MIANLEKLRFTRTAAPLYRDVTNALERALRDGVWKSGQKIPTEQELERQFSASRGTLRIAIGELVRRGLLARQPGRGTFVLGPSFNTLTRFFRFERRDSHAPLVPKALVLARDVTKADDGIAKALHVEAGDEVGYVRRLRQHESEPFLLLDCYFHMDAWRQVSGADFTTHELYDLLKDNYGLYIVRADEFLRADLASDTEAEMLRIPKGSPVFRVERIAYTFDNRPVEYRRGVCRADQIHYHVRLE